MVGNLNHESLPLSPLYLHKMWKENYEYNPMFIKPLRIDEIGSTYIEGIGSIHINKFSVKSTKNFHLNNVSTEYQYIKFQCNHFCIVRTHFIFLFVNCKKELQEFCFCDNLTVRAYFIIASTINQNHDG